MADIDIEPWYAAKLIFGWYRNGSSLPMRG